jgi:hypothetical protein
MHRYREARLTWRSFERRLARVNSAADISQTSREALLVVGTAVGIE